MISIIVTFRFSDSNLFGERKDAVLRVFSYWALVKNFFNLDLVFIDDHSVNIGLQETFIHPMPGQKNDWNIAAVRNFGATIAKGNNLLFTDIDHVIYGNFEALDAVCTNEKYFSFPRKEKRGDSYVDIHSHKNTFLIKKEDFIKYDEDFCGNYGYEDSEFFYRLNKTHKQIFTDLVLAYLTNLRSAPILRNLEINKMLLYKK